MTLACPLCTSEQTQHYFEDKNRTYQQCTECELIFVPSNYHLNHDEEKLVYDFHENSPQDQGYRQFLNKLLAPLTKKLPHQARGLDFGCGPGPTIKPMLEEFGFMVENYDIYYHNVPELLHKQFDFITCTEAIEHFSNPRKELQLIDQALKTGGYLGLMTKRATNLEAFKNWHYKNDPTHISFFSEATFQWIAQWLEYTVDFPGSDTIILKKRS
jgi:SAM-dependent methyltransferase